LQPPHTDAPAAELDQRSQLSRRLTIAIATPLVLLVVLGLVLGRLLLEMAEDSAWVEHPDQVLAQANDTLRQVADQENAVASYLVARDRELLAPFEGSHPLESFQQLRELVSDNREQQARFEAAREQYQAWLSVAGPVVEEGETSARGVARWREGKAHIDAMREQLTAAIGVEEGLRRARVKAAAGSTESTKVAFVGLLAGAAFLLAILSRR
jgi:CHASE3 domain sensor protein